MQNLKRMVYLGAISWVVLFVTACPGGGGGGGISIGGGIGGCSGGGGGSLGGILRGGGSGGSSSGSSGGGTVMTGGGDAAGGAAGSSTGSVTSTVGSVAADGAAVGGSAGDVVGGIGGGTGNSTGDSMPVNPPTPDVPRPIIINANYHSSGFPLPDLRWLRWIFAYQPASSAQSKPESDDQDIAIALKMALAEGAAQAVEKYAQPEAVDIAVPVQLRRIKIHAERYGEEAKWQALETAMQHAAQRAVQRSAPHFQQAIGELAIANPKAILKGSNDAATRYFQQQQASKLKKALQKIVKRDDKLTQALQHLLLATQYLDDAQAFDLPQLREHIVDVTLQAMFMQMAQAEAQIRQHPEQQKLAAMRRVFGQQIAEK